MGPPSPDFGSSRPSGLQSSSGHRPARSTVSKSSATHSNRSMGNARGSATVHPSRPGALLLAMA
eukprot:406285-Alexandrium_andersonii.AAC.1